MNKIICIIPARRGSKRIKNKNFKSFYGKPIISRVIQELKKFNIFDKIVVSTNCSEVKNIANKFGVEVLNRTEKLSDDTTDTKTVIVDAIKKLEKMNLNFEKVLCVYPTAVFLRIKHLKLAIRKLKKKLLLFIRLKNMNIQYFAHFIKTIMVKLN